MQQPPTTNLHSSLLHQQHATTFSPQSRTIFRHTSRTRPHSYRTISRHIGKRDRIPARRTGLFFHCRSHTSLPHTPLLTPHTSFSRSSHLIPSLLRSSFPTPRILHLPPRILHLTPRILHLAPRKKGRPNNRAAFSTGIREAIVPLRDRPPECGRNIRR